jgi:hypothetical protein
MAAFLPFRGRTVAGIDDPAPSPMLRAGVPFISLPSLMQSRADLGFRASERKIVIARVDFS